MKIKDLKEPYRSIAEFDCKNQGKEKYINEDFNKGSVINWHTVKAGWDFYNSLDRGIYPPITEQIKLDYPEVFTHKDKSLKMETETKFKFNVGDKVSFPYLGEKRIIVIDFIGKEKIFGTDENGKECSYSKVYDFVSHEEPKEKIKLKKFYYTDSCGGWSILYAESKEKIAFLKLLTEQEFLEQFEII